MSAFPISQKLTLAEYLAIERTAEFKSEFYQGEMFPVHPPTGPRMMAGASRFHNVINENLSGELFNRLKGSSCRTLSRDQRVKIDRTGLYCYPDLIIVCGPPEYAIEDPDTLVNPHVVMEVLSDSTEKYDRTTKFRHYKQLPTVMEYLLVSQDEPLVERFTRSADGTWAQADFVGCDAILQLSTVPVELPLADVYSGVEFPVRGRPGGPAVTG